MTLADLERLLSLVEQGKISVESALRAAASEGDRLGAWAARSAKRTRRQPARQVMIREPVPLVQELRDALLQIATQRLGKKRGVVGFSWGLEYVGAKPSGEHAIVAWVERKLARRRVSKSQMLPGRFTTTYGGRRCSIPIDVRTVPRGEKHSITGSVRPGNRVAIDVGGARGTLSAVVTEGALVSGHVAKRTGADVSARLPNGDTVALGKVTSRIRVDQYHDSALVGDLDPETRELLALSPAPVRELGSTDVGTFVRIAKVDGEVKCVVASVGAPANFGAAGSMVGLVELDRSATLGGDSGAPALDDGDAIVGFVVGAARSTDPTNTMTLHTYLLPGGRALDV